LLFAPLGALGQNLFNANRRQGVLGKNNPQQLVSKVTILLLGSLSPHQAQHKFNLLVLLLGDFVPVAPAAATVSSVECGG
jgi:hypothetical protein